MQSRQRTFCTIGDSRSVCFAHTHTRKNHFLTIMCNTKKVAFASLLTDWLAWPNILLNTNRAAIVQWNKELKTETIVGNVVHFILSPRSANSSHSSFSMFSALCSTMHQEDEILPAHVLAFMSLYSQTGGSQRFYETQNLSYKVILLFLHIQS